MSTFFLSRLRQKLLPPERVRGMTELDRLRFKTAIDIPTLLCPRTSTKHVMACLKPYLLKMEKLFPVRDPLSVPSDMAAADYREIMFNPTVVTNWFDLPTSLLTAQSISEQHFRFEPLDLCYDNWGAAEIIKSVLPADMEGITSYSRIGHILHVNLRAHLLPYKRLIGEVLLSKVPNVRCVVNKCDVISNTYRFFNFELLCGTANYVVETKENGCRYRLDFSKVYWNPRLSTEHERINAIIKSRDVVYDVFAGVGPFAVPAAKKSAAVFANDLNPDSVFYLKQNIKLNHKYSSAVCYNMDGVAFINDIIRMHLIERWSEFQQVTNSSYIIMNLPAMAITFLKQFRGLLKDAPDIDYELPDFTYPIIFCYTFAKGNNATAEKQIKLAVEESLGLPMTPDIFKEVNYVRNVGTSNNMYRVTLELNKYILTTSSNSSANALTNMEKVLTDATTTTTTTTATTTTETANSGKRENDEINETNENENIKRPKI